MIREATIDDVEMLLPLAHEFHRGTTHYNEYDVEMEEEAVCDMIAYLIRDPKGCVLIASVDGKLAGTVGMLASPLWSAPSHKTGVEIFYYVFPEYRRSGIAEELFRSMEIWVKDNGLSSFNMVALERMNGPVVGKLYERRGYKKIETSYSKRF